MFNIFNILKGKIMSEQEEQVEQVAVEPVAEAPVEAPAVEAETPAEEAPKSASEEPASAQPVEAGMVLAYYNGSQIVERLEEVNGDGRLCKLADGTTAFVPLALLGE